MQCDIAADVQFVIADCTDSDIYILNACGPGRVRGLKRCRVIVAAANGRFGWAAAVRACTRVRGLCDAVMLPASR